MLRTMTVRQPPHPRPSLRRSNPVPRRTIQGERSSSLQRLRFGPFLVSLCLCLAGIAVYTWPRVQVVRLAYRVQTSEQRLTELLQARDQLRFELASLKDPRRIYHLATERLGMSPPRQDQVVVVTHESHGR